LSGRVDASQLLAGWTGRTVATLTGAPNRILHLDDSTVRVVTGQSGATGEAVELAEVQQALDLFAADDVIVHPDNLGHRSSFCGAVLRTLPGAVRAQIGRRQAVIRRDARQPQKAGKEDLGSVRPWWSRDTRERYWMEITDRSDIGTDLHCPQRDIALRPSPGFSAIWFLREGDVVVHYNKNVKAIVAWSLVAGQVEAAPTLWTSHRRSTVQRVGSTPRLQPGWWVDLEGPFLLTEPVSLGQLRQRGSDILATQAALSASHGRIYAPFCAHGENAILRPTQYYLTKLPQSVVGLLPELAECGATPDAVSSVPTAGQDGLDSDGPGVPWREPEATPRPGDHLLIEINTEAVERGLKGHVETERALGTALRAFKIEPQAPQSAAINYDLLWEHRGVLYVAEVKSTTPRNEDKQLRLGLGQVIWYRHKLVSKLSRNVVAVLVPESRPSDGGWYDACADAGVILLPRDDIDEWLRQLVKAAGA
jgi:hypothetical protein